jgi:hypothetical protein
MKENSRAVIVQLSEERGWVVASNNARVYIKVFNSREYQSYYIDSYAKEGETTREYIKPSEDKPTEFIQDVDSIAEVVE